MRLAAAAVLALSAAVTIAAPLAGLAVAGHPLAPYLAFPPRTERVVHAPFAWGAFIAYSLPAFAAVALFWAALASTRSAEASKNLRRFPWWGWLGLGLAAAGWFLAWSDALVPSPWRRHTFTPLWLGYILAMNGLVVRRAGWSPLTHRRAWFLTLFPVSAGFWWLFEFLNQFVHNWYYTGIEASDDWDYFLQATLPFSTVLPAVASTWAWLRQFPRLDAMTLPALRGHSGLGWPALVAGTLGLGGIGIWPETFYALLWLSPLLILCGLQQVLVGETILTPLRQGDWRPLLQPALAALACGLLWEMWNYGSLARWHYSIPYVQRFQLFEMPLPGYAGYLGFGIECACVMDLVARLVERRPLWPLARAMRSAAACAR